MRKIMLALVLVAMLSLCWVVPTGATTPTATITMRPRVVSSTNTQDAWPLGVVTTSQPVCFSATGSDDDDYSQIENTSNAGVAIEIQGEDSDSGDYDPTLASDGSPGGETYGLLATSEATPIVYDRKHSTITKCFG